MASILGRIFEGMVEGVGEAGTFTFLHHLFGGHHGRVRGQGTQQQAAAQANATTARENTTGKAIRIASNILNEHKEWRIELRNFLNRMEDQEAARNLLRNWADRQAKGFRRYAPPRRYQDGDETTFVSVMIGFLRFLNGPGEMHDRDELMRYLCHLGAEELDREIEMAKNDTLEQFGKKVARRFRAADRTTARGIDDLHGWLRTNGFVRR